MNDSINIEAIIKLVREQVPEQPEIIAALKRCSGGKWTSSGYYQFIDSKNANQPGAAWQIAESIVLEQENKGDIVLDVLKDGQIGGIEFIDLIEQ